MFKFIAYLIILCLFSQCAIHDKSPFICFKLSCIRGQYSIKPLKKRVKASLNNSKRKRELAKNKRRKKENSNYDVVLQNDSILKHISDSISNINNNGRLALLDTTIKINYINLNDSVLQHQKATITTFINKVGQANISEITLTDFYNQTSTGNKQSVKKQLFKFILKNGIYKNKVYTQKNNYLNQTDSTNNHQNLQYLEIRIH